MMLLIFALMTAAAIFAVLWPLARARTRLRAGNDIAVYRDQIEEIARDRDAGLIGAAEADAARVEVARRLLAADAAGAETEAAPGATLRRRATAVGVLVALPAIAAGFYLTLGSPELPGQPFASRPAAPLQDQSVETLVARVEAHLEAKPDDGRGWEVVAPFYLRLGRFEDAVKARRNALQFNGANADREADLGEALIYAGNGIVTADAKAAFERALAHAPKHFKARYFLAVAAQQDGQGAAAARIFRAMLADARPDSPWVPMVRQALARVEGTAPGPSAEDVAAAEQTSPEDRADDGARHGRAARRAAEAGRLGRRGLAAAGARLYGDGRSRAGAVRRGRCAPRARP